MQPGVDAVDLAVEARVGQHGMVFGMLPLDEQPPLVRIPWVQARVVLLADAGAEVGHGEHATVQGVLRIGQATAGVEAVEELPDRRGVRALVVGLAEALAAVAGDVDELGDGGRVQAGPFARPAHPCGDHARQGVAVDVVEDDLGRHPVEQESGDLGRADPQRPAGIVVRPEVHQQPGTVLGRLLGQAGCVRGGEELGDDGVAFCRYRSRAQAAPGGRARAWPGSEPARAPGTAATRH